MTMSAAAVQRLLSLRRDGDSKDAANRISWIRRLQDEGCDVGAGPGQVVG